MLDELELDSVEEMLEKINVEEANLKKATEAKK
jgi:hypothetical protein